ncbi:hypothetical protein FBU30_006367 [Linnemannia zychae]|nr:hypothetical protein FBU30_006367 [Linnemannia zychae]
MGTGRAPQTHSEGAVHDTSASRAPQSYPPPGQPNTEASQVNHYAHRAPQLYCAPEDQANNVASPQPYLSRNPFYNAKDDAIKELHSSLASPQAYIAPMAVPPQIAAKKNSLAATLREHRPPPPPPKDKLSATITPRMSNLEGFQMPVIPNQPVVSTPLSPTRQNSTFYPSPATSCATTVSSNMSPIQHASPMQQYTPTQLPTPSHQHTSIQKQTSMLQQHQQHALIPQHSPVQQNTPSRYSTFHDQQNTSSQQQTHISLIQQQANVLQQINQTYTSQHHANQATNATQSHSSHQQPDLASPCPPPYSSIVSHNTPTVATVHHFQQNPPASVQPMVHPIAQQLAPAAAAAVSHFHPLHLMRVCCITLANYNKIRLIGANPETVTGLRKAIVDSGVALHEDVAINITDGHEFRLKDRPWRQKEVESIMPRLLLLVILKSMANSYWNIVQSTTVSKIGTDREFMMFESVDPGLGPISHLDVDMFMLAMVGKDRIRIIGAGHSTPAVVHIVKQAFLAHWKHAIKKDIIVEQYHEFQIEGNPWTPQKSEEAAIRICIAQLLANMGSIGFKIYVSLDIQRSFKVTESECLVFRRMSRVWR